MPLRWSPVVCLPYSDWIVHHTKQSQLIRSSHFFVHHAVSNNVGQIKLYANDHSYFL